MEIKFGTNRLFPKLIEAIAKSLDIVTFVVTKDAIKLKGMDPSHIAMVDLLLPKQLAEGYHIEKDQRLNINMVDLNRYLKKTQVGEELTLSLDTHLNKLIIQVKGQKRNRTYKYPLLAEDDEEEAPTPNLDFDEKIKIDTSEFKAGIKDCDIADFCTFVIDGDRFLIIGTSDAGEMEVEFLKDKVESWEVKSKTAKSMFSMEYLLDMVDVPITKTIQLEFSQEMPTRLTYELEHGGYLKMLLAPRVEEEEDEAVEDQEGMDEDEGEEDSTEEESEVEVKSKKPTKTIPTKSKKQKSRNTKETEEEEIEEEVEEAE